MLETITPDEVDLNGSALAVRYQPDPQRPELLLVSMFAHLTEGDEWCVGRSELRLVVVQERMTADAMRARAAAEAARRGIERVAWIELPLRGRVIPGEHTNDCLHPLLASSHAGRFFDIPTGAPCAVPLDMPGHDGDPASSMASAAPSR